MQAEIKQKNIYLVEYNKPEFLSNKSFNPIFQIQINFCRF